MNPKEQPPNKKTGVTKAVLPNVQSILWVLLRTILRNSRPRRGFHRIYAFNLVIDCSNKVEFLSKFGPVPEGSVLSRQQFPELLLPEQPHHYNVTLNNTEFWWTCIMIILMCWNWKNRLNFRMPLFFNKIVMFNYQ